MSACRGALGSTSTQVRAEWPSGQVQQWGRVSQSVDRSQRSLSRSLQLEEVSLEHHNSCILTRFLTPSTMNKVRP